MKSNFTMITLFLSILISGCAVITVDYDYDANFDFSNLTRYTWLEIPVDYPTEQFSIQRVKTAVNQQMKDKGFILTTSDTDFLVSIQGYKKTVRQAPQSTSASQVSGQRLANEQFQHGMFTITMVDTKSDRLIWQGHAKGVASPNLSTEDRIEKINVAVVKMLSNFPPINK